MKKYSTLRILLIGFLFAVSSSFLSSCEDSVSDPEPEPEPGETEESFVLSLAYQGTEGTFTYYTVPFDDVMTGSLSAVGQGLDHLGYYTYNQVDDAIYATGGFELTDIIAITKTDEGELIETGGISSFDNSLQDVVKAEDGKLIGIEMSSDSDVIALHQIDPATVTLENSTFTAASNLSDSTSAYSGMVQTGDYLFVSYYASNPTSFATTLTDTARVAVFSYPGLEFQKVIKDDRTGPIGGFGTLAGLIKDENGNVYALSHSNPANGYSQFTKDPAILRIDSGESEFNEDYLFDFNEITEGKTTAHMVYLGDNKVFVEMNTQDRSEQVIWSDGPLQPAIIDLTSQTINYIDGVPDHAGSGRKLTATSLWDGEYIYLVVPENETSYVYQIDPENYTATKGAEVQANFVAGFFKL